jgi:hypothetical protein
LIRVPGGHKKVQTGLVSFDFGVPGWKKQRRVLATPSSFRWDSRLPGRANISNRFLCWVNALIVTLVILIGILIMHEATVGILAGIKDVIGDPTTDPKDHLLSGTPQRNGKLRTFSPSFQG